MKRIPLFIFLLFIVQSTYSQPCQAGEFESNSTCVPCAEGFFQDQPGQTSCIACPAGRVQPNTGGISCIDCAAGTYAGTEGQAQCTPCELGRAQPNTRSDSCEICPVGTYADSQGQVQCTPCGENMTTAQMGSTSASQCIPVNNNIPTLSQWGLILLGLCLSILGLVAVRQKFFSVETK